MLSQEVVIDRIGGLDGVDIVTATRESGAPEVAWGDTFFIYDPDRILTGTQRFPFCTTVTKDYGEFDRLSNLNRPGVFRLNIGLSAHTYISLFGHPGNDHLAGGGRDFSLQDVLMPHPVYARQHWVCIVTPTETTFERTIWPLIIEAHERAAARYLAIRKNNRVSTDG